MQLGSELKLNCPAKINILLAITHPREDGFHDLVSLVAPVALGDTLTVSVTGVGEADTLECQQEGVPTDGSNLVLKAAALFRRSVPVPEAFHFVLDKCIPHGAGLGGGSSDGAKVLQAMNRLTGHPLGVDDLRSLAVVLGSDCPLFLEEKPVIMRGRGEQLETLSAREAAALQGKRVLLFKPDFAIQTGWAYGQMRASGKDYCPSDEAECRLRKWRDSLRDEDLPLYNNMETVAFRKYLALPALLQILRERFNVAVRMSGSGSACFLFPGPDENEEAITAMIRECWGDATWLEWTSLL